MEFNVGNKVDSKHDDAELNFNKWDKLTIITKYPNPFGSGFHYRYFDMTCDEKGNLTVEENK